MHVLLNISQIQLPPGRCCLAKVRNDRYWERLCTPCSIEILSVLAEVDRATKTDLCRRIDRSRQTVHKTVKLLTDAGFVSVDCENQFPGRKFHSLSESGRVLASARLSTLPQLQPHDASGRPSIFGH